MPTSRLPTSFATSPRPTGPQWKRLAGSPDRVEGRRGPREGVGVAAAHDRERPLVRSGRPAAHRAVEVGDPAPAHSSASSRATAGAIVLSSTSTGGGADAASMPSTTSRTSSESVTHEQARSAPVDGLGHRGDEDGGKIGGAGGRPSVEAHLVAGGGEVAHHSAAHQARAHEADQHPATIPAVPPGGRGGEGVRAVPTLDPVTGGALPGRPETLCPSATSLRTAARGQWERPSIEKRARGRVTSAPPGGMVTNVTNPVKGRVFGPGPPWGCACACGGIPAIHPPVTTLPSDHRSWLRTAAHPVRRLGAWLATLIIGTARRSAADDITGVGSQFAYNAFLATVPFLFVLVSVLGLVAEPDTFDEFLADDADNAIPVELREILRSSLRSATANTGQAALFLAIGLIAALYVSANVMGALVGGLDRARDVPAPAVGARQARRADPGPRSRASWCWRRRSPWSAARAWWRAWRRRSSAAARPTWPGGSCT